MKKQLLITILLSLTIVTQAQQYTYEIPHTPWKESFGNHRTTISVDKSSEVVSLDYLGIVSK